MPSIQILSGGGGGGAAVSISEDGVQKVEEATDIDFVGLPVTDDGDETVTIQAAIAVQEDGAVQVAESQFINFTGGAVSNVTSNGDGIDVQTQVPDTDETATRYPRI